LKILEILFQSSDKEQYQIILQYLLVPEEKSERLKIKIL